MSPRVTERVAGALEALRTRRAPRSGAQRVAGAVTALGPKKWRLIGLAILFLFYALAWLEVTAGARVLVGPLVVVPVIVILVAAGNWLQSWLGIDRPSPKFTEREHHDETSAPDAERP